MDECLTMAAFPRSRNWVLIIFNWSLTPINPPINPSVDDGVLIVLVLAVDKREKMAAYQSALERLLSRS